MPHVVKTPNAGRPSSPSRNNPRSRISVPGNSGIKVVRAVTIQKDPEILYDFWRDVTNLPQIVSHPVAIEARSPLDSHWNVNAPAGRRMEWDAIIINDEPGKLIAWRTKEGGDVPNAGSIRFEPAPGDEGTEVTVRLEYNPPGGKVGAAVAKLTRDSASSQVYDALRRFKALMEAGEIPTTEGQSVGGPQRDQQKKGRK